MDADLRALSPVRISWRQFAGVASLAWYDRVPLLYLVAGAVVAGDGAGARLPLWTAALAGGAAGGLFIVSRRGAGMLVALLAIALAASAAAARVYHPPYDPANIRNLPENQSLYLEGIIEGASESIPGGVRFQMRATRARVGAAVPRGVTGTVRVTVLAPGRYRLGERVGLTTRLRFPRDYGDPGEFDYAAYMARQGIDATALVRKADAIVALSYAPRFPWSEVEGARERLGGLIDRALRQPQRGEMRALIIGDRGALDPDVRQTFALDGMAHLLVISGLHLGFVAGAAFALIRLCCWLFPYLLIRGYANKLAAAASGVAVLAYAAVAGGHVSTLRALIMVLCYVIAVISDRGREAMASLALAALLICLAFPGSSSDLGFQLSFTAVAAVLLGMRRFSAWWNALEARVQTESRGRLLRGMTRLAQLTCGYVAVSFFALLGTAPLTAHYFNQFSIVGLIANAVVVPIMAFGGVVLGLCAAVLSLLSASLAIDLMRVAGLAVMVSNHLARDLVGWPAAWVRTFTPTGIEVVLCYALIGLWLLAPLKAPGTLAAAAAIDDTPRDRWRRGGALAAMVLLALAADAGWWVHARYFDPRLRVTFLAVGQGDAAVVQFPGSKVMLIDGGSRYGQSDFGQRVVAPFLWSRKIMHVDTLALSHPELDHFGGFQFVAENFHPDWFWTTGAISHDVSFRALLNTLQRLGTHMVVMNDSVPALRIAGVTVHCLAPERNFSGSRNNNSMVLELSDGRTSFLFMGDVEARGERQLVRRDPRLPVTVLKVPHHGSATSSTPLLIGATRPRFAVISAGYYNRYRFPAPAVVARYDAAGARVLMTSRAGAIGFVTDGGTLDLWTGAAQAPLSASP